jgi:SsrA-binding protein
MAPPGAKIVASNRLAHHNYDLLDTVEAGLVLRGSEVKSLRESKVTIAEAYGRIEDGEAWILGLHIAPWITAGVFGDHDSVRRRKLLLHANEIDRLKSRLDQEHLSLIPLELYFKGGRAKLEMALARGRNKGDKRHAIAKRDADREAAKAMGRANKGMD